MIKNKLIILFCFKIRKSIKHKNVQKIKNKKAILLNKENHLNI